MTDIPQTSDLRRAHRRVAPYIHRTPVMTSRQVNERAGAAVFCKCENLQRTGAFKIRGATNAVMSLAADEVRCGVATHSSGNHGAALARAAAQRDMSAHIVMPDTASRAKIQAVQSYGGRIVYCSGDPASRQQVLDQVIADTGACLVHPFDDYRIIAGQATAGLELVEQVPDLDAVLVPVGGGGLLAGTALAMQAASPSTRVIGVEPANVDDALRSFHAGRILPVAGDTSIADGLLTTIGARPFEIISRHVHDIVTVEEAQIVKAMRFVWTRMKIIVEPSAAVPMAALLSGCLASPGRRIGMILSGGNIDLDRLPWS